MEFATLDNLKQRKRADMLVLPFWKDKKQAMPAGDFRDFRAFYDQPIKAEDFTGKEGEVVVLYSDESKDTRIALLGLGEKDKVSVERLRRAYASVLKNARARKAKELNIVIPQNSTLAPTAVLRGVVEGMMLANYSFDKLKHDALKDNPTFLVKKANLIGTDKHGLALARKHQAIVEATHYARDLVNSNADDATPQHIAEMAQKLAKEVPNVKTTVFNKQRIEKEKMELLLAVNKGSHIDPCFIIIEYKGNPKSKDRTVLVGKAVTYDTGGLHLKPFGSMETMKADMSGSATVLGTIKAAATIGLKVNIIGVIPATENAIGPAAYKPGDVYSSYAGKTVEIGSTDAEGRLILADALAYAVKNLNPTRMIDFATLTGACSIALGNETIGLMSNQDALADAITRAGYETYERAWRLPLFEEYKDQLKSDVADINNIGGRAAGAITAGLFLQEFVGDVPWAHCDIAGTAFLSDSKRYHPKHGTGVGVRLMVEFLENL